MSLTKFALFAAVTGTAILLILSQKIEPKLLKISEVDDAMIGRYVRVQGNILSSKDYGDFFIMSLQDETGKIAVVAYGMKENITGNVEITGKVKEYRGRIEIEVSKIESK